ncbi:MAG: hypothetical protein FJX23_02225 [Alphaproteobacteria bacterium]|nr:hypothetical protein [Alphaproteobacteria bacterium]
MTSAAAKQQEIRFITSEEAGEPCWYYVKVPAEKLSAFDTASASAGFDPRGYGIILESGLGEHPSQDVVSFMEQEYGFITR